MEQQSITVLVILAAITFILVYHAWKNNIYTRVTLAILLIVLFSSMLAYNVLIQSGYIELSQVYLGPIVYTCTDFIVVTLVALFYRIVKTAKQNEG